MQGVNNINSIKGLNTVNICVVSDTVINSFIDFLDVAPMTDRKSVV